MITDNGLEAMLDFRHGRQQTFSLVDAQELLESRLKILDKELQKVCEKHGISESLINTARDAEGCSAYIVGIVAGVWLANRPDIIRKFAKMYAKTTPEHSDLLFDDDGEHVNRRVN